MKKLLFYLIIVISILGACETNKSNVKEEAESVNSSAVDETKEVEDIEAEDEIEVDENEVTDGYLEKPGQWFRDEDGTIVTLKHILEFNKVLDLDAIQMQLYDIALVKRNNFGAVENLIEISYKIENTSDLNIMFRGIKAITTNTKHQIDVSSTNLGSYEDQGTSDYYGNVAKEGFIIVPYPGETFDELDTLSIITEIVWDDDNMDIIHDSITEEIQLY